LDKECLPFVDRFDRIPAFASAFKSPFTGAFKNSRLRVIRLASLGCGMSRIEWIDASGSDVGIVAEIPIAVEQRARVAPLDGSSLQIMHQRVGAGGADVGITEKGFGSRPSMAPYRR